MYIKLFTKPTTCSLTEEWLKYGTFILWNTTGTVLKKNEATNILTWKGVYNRSLGERRL